MPRPGSGPAAPAQTVRRLRAAGCVYAEEEAALLHEASQDGQRLEGLLRRRVAGEPLELVLGWAAFCGVRVLLEPGVFVPRRRTELVVREALAACRHLPAPLLVDLCCGSGAVGTALRAALPGAEVYAADVDPAAVRCARRNLPADHVLEGDLYDALPRVLRGTVDVLAVNTPYVPSPAIATMPAEARDHEPRVALDGGPDGLDVARRVVAGAPAWLRPGGVLVLETSERQAPLLTGAFRDAGLTPRVASSRELDATAVVGTAGPPR